MDLISLRHTVTPPEFPELSLPARKLGSELQHRVDEANNPILENLNLVDLAKAANLTHLQAVNALQELNNVKLISIAEHNGLNGFNGQAMHNLTLEFDVITFVIYDALCEKEQVHQWPELQTFFKGNSKTGKDLYRYLREHHHTDIIHLVEYYRVLTWEKPRQREW